MAARIEHEILVRLQHKGSPEQIADHLISAFKKADLSEAERGSIIQFLLLSDKVEEAAVYAAECLESKLFLAPAVLRQIAARLQLTKQEQEDWERALNDQTEDVLRQIEYCKINSLFERERELLGELEVLSPRLFEPLIADFKIRLAERELSDLRSALRLSQEGRNKTDSFHLNPEKNTEDLEAQNSVTTALKDWVNEQSISSNASEQRSYDSGIACLFMDLPKQALDFFLMPPTSLRKQELALEASLLAERPVQTLELATRLREQLDLGSESGSSHNRLCAVLYAQARAYHQLGQLESARELYQALREVEPQYRMTEMHLGEVERELRSDRR